jgi:formamidopyrimidine-DNA glycosylase
MPELPEVETIRRDLSPRLVGRRVARACIHPGAERLAITHPPRLLECELAGRRIEELGRHGKYLLAPLDDGRTWVLHLRMTGSLVHVAAGAAPHRFERARVDLDDGSSLRLNDMRKFSTWHLVEDPAEAMPNCGPDALSDAFSVAWLRNALARRTTSVKAVLLDQAVAAGVGNIYADEACWIAGIDPRRPACEVGPRRATRLHAAVRQTLEVSLVNRGSTFSDYRDGLGAEGLHLVQVHVFRREGLPCHRCGSTILKTRVAGRGTHLCPRCQR